MLAPVIMRKPKNSHATSHPCSRSNESAGAILEMIVKIGFVFLFTGSALEAAAQMMKDSSRASVSPGFKSRDIGDEMIWHPSPHARGGMILIRKAHVFVKPSGSAMDDVQRFARHIEALIVTR